MEEQRQAETIVNETLTKLREMRGLAGDLEVIGHRAFTTPGLDEIATDCVQQLREALEALDVAQTKIKAAGRALYVINMPALAMTADAA